MSLQVSASSSGITFTSLPQAVVRQMVVDFPAEMLGRLACVAKYFRNIICRDPEFFPSLRARKIVQNFSSYLFEKELITLPPQTTLCRVNERIAFCFCAPPNASQKIVCLHLSNGKPFDTLELNIPLVSMAVGNNDLFLLNINGCLSKYDTGESIQLIDEAQFLGLNLENRLLTSLLLLKNYVLVQTQTAEGNQQYRVLSREDLSARDSLPITTNHHYKGSEESNVFIELHESYTRLTIYDLANKTRWELQLEAPRVVINMQVHKNTLYLYVKNGTEDWIQAVDLKSHISRSFKIGTNNREPSFIMQILNQYLLLLPGKGFNRAALINLHTNKVKVFDDWNGKEKKALDRNAIKGIPVPCSFDEGWIRRHVLDEKKLTLQTIDFGFNLKNRSLNLRRKVMHFIKGYGTGIVTPLIIVSIGVMFICAIVLKIGTAGLCKEPTKLSPHHFSKYCVPMFSIVGFPISRFTWSILRVITFSGVILLSLRWWYYSKREKALLRNSH